MLRYNLLKNYISALGVIAFILLVFLTQCQRKNEQQVIVFSCSICKGCVENNLRYIEFLNIDEKVKIIVDTVCLNRLGISMDSYNIVYHHMPFEKIVEKYGFFGNFILVNKNGSIVEFKTDMHLNSFFY